MPLLNVVILLAVFVLVAARVTWVVSRTTMLRSLLPPGDIARPPYRLLRWRHGSMMANPNDFYMGRAIIEYGECCEIERRFLAGAAAARPGLVVEVGANMGVHTIPLAKALAQEAREMIAFEPQPFVFQNLCANLALNSLGNVTAWPWACGAKAETVYFDAPDYYAAGNFGGVSMGSSPGPRRVPVPCVRLDDVVASAGVALLKIDVEGGELAVLQGAVGLLSRSRPLLYVENDRVEKSQALIEWLWSQKYRLYWHIPRLFNPDNFFKKTENIYGGVSSFNMLGLPRESDAPAEGLQEVVDASDHPLGR